MAIKLNVKTYIGDTVLASSIILDSKNRYSIKVIKPGWQVVRAGGLIGYKTDKHLVLKTADCVPLVISSDQAPIIILLHIGWLGAPLNLVKKSITKAKNKFNISGGFKAFLGPSICKKHYSNGGWKGLIKLLIYKIFGQGEFVHRDNNRWHFDFKGVTLKQLADLGISDVTQSDKCTYCDNLPSRRREGKNKKSNIITEAWLTYE